MASAPSCNRTEIPTQTRMRTTSTTLGLGMLHSTWVVWIRGEGGGEVVVGGGGLRYGSAPTGASDRVWQAADYYTIITVNTDYYTIITVTNPHQHMFMSMRWPITEAEVPEVKY